MGYNTGGVAGAENHLQIGALTRRALGLGEDVHVTDADVARHAWRLAYGGGAPDAGDLGLSTPDACVDFVVGVVEAIEEVVGGRIAAGADVTIVKAHVSDEVGLWVQDFVADGGGKGASPALLEAAGKVAWAVADALVAQAGTT